MSKRKKYTLILVNSDKNRNKIQSQFKDKRHATIIDNDELENLFLLSYKKLDLIATDRFLAISNSRSNILVSVVANNIIKASA